jgi:phosphatidylglycerophosphatase C
VIVAAFDFDGTLTRRDSLVPFLASQVGRAVTARGIVAAAKTWGDRSARKQVLLDRTLAGRPVDEIVEAGEAYAARLVARGMRTDTLALLDDHRSNGHRPVIVSASPELYVQAAGRLLGIDDVLATRLEVDDRGRLTGRYDGRNCLGEEKVVRLEEWFAGREATLLYAYGNSSGDDALLARADVPTRV